MAEIASYRAIRAEAARVGWPVAYRADLTKHDLAACRRLQPGERFVWALRETGTDLYALGRASIAWARAQVQEHRWYLWTGAELRLLGGKAEAVAILEEAEEQIGRAGGVLA
jgi:hypothetical protein